MTWHLLILTALAQWTALAAIMAAGWYAWARTRNSGWVDVTWTFAVGLVGAASAALLSVYPLVGETWTVNHLLAGAMITVWALRLGLYIAGRTAGISDDPRYAKFIEEWGDGASRNMFWFLQAQAFFGVPLTLAVALAASNPAPLSSPGPLLGLALLVIALSGSALSDRQLAAFKAAKAAGATDAKVCDTGLWGWSRHPNYFFETLIWAAFAIYAIDVSGDWLWGYAALAAPLCMYWLLRYVSGVPPLEDHMVARYGDAYRAYQRRTSVFVPWPPRTERARLAGAYSNSKG